MLDLYFSATPNGLKIRLFLEETGLPYRIVPMRLSAGDQFAPEFVALSPNRKIPVIVDHAPKDQGQPVTVFESGVILLYLAEKSGKLLPQDNRTRLEMLQWLFWQMSALGPMGGQAGYFRIYAPKPVPEAITAKLVELSAGHRKIILYANPGKEGFYVKLGFRRMRTAMAIFQDQEKATREGLVEAL